MQLVLASASARRAKLLTDLQLAFAVFACDIDETPVAGETPSRTAVRLAQAKAACAARSYSPETVIIAADCCMEITGTHAGKPADSQATVRMLESAAGTQALVHTAINVSRGVAGMTVLRQGRIAFRKYTAAAIRAYLDASPSAVGAEGAFAVDQAGPMLCESISEDEPGTISGLPMISLCRALREHGVALPN